MQSFVANRRSLVPVPRVSGREELQISHVTYLQTCDSDSVVIAGYHLLEVQIAFNLLDNALLGLLLGAGRVAQGAEN